MRRKIHDSYFLINIIQNCLDDCCTLYENNEVSDFIWKNLYDSEEIEIIVDRLLSCLGEEVDKTIILQDVEEYIELLCQEGFVEACDGRN